MLELVSLILNQVIASSIYYLHHLSPASMIVKMPDYYWDISISGLSIQIFCLTQVFDLTEF